MLRIIWLIAVLSVCGGVWAQGTTTAVISIRYASASELGKVLGVGGGMRPDGIDAIWALPERNSLVVRAAPAAIEQLREILAILDQPSRRVEVAVQLLVVPAGAESAEAGMDWPAPDPRRPNVTRWITGRFGEVLGALKKRGEVKTLDPVQRTPLVANSNRTLTVWFSDPPRGVADPKAIAAGVEVTPRVNADDTVTVSLHWVQAFADEAVGARIEGLGDQAQITLPSGEDAAIAVPYRKGEGDQSKGVLLMLTPRLLPDSTGTWPGAPGLDVPGRK
jgi:hypothetical protein